MTATIFELKSWRPRGRQLFAFGRERRAMRVVAASAEGDHTSSFAAGDECANRSTGCLRIRRRVKCKVGMRKKGRTSGARPESGQSEWEGLSGKTNPSRRFAPTRRESENAQRIRDFCVATAPACDSVLSGKLPLIGLEKPQKFRKNSISMMDAVQNPVQYKTRTWPLSSGAGRRCRMLPGGKSWDWLCALTVDTTLKKLGKRRVMSTGLGRFSPVP